MHVILTHEQADFDALASLLGAHLINEDTVPVLPRRMNRNVRSFLTLYGVELPFVDPRDLPNQSIGTVTLVDTQSYVSLKGMDEKPEIQVIDHHPLRETTPSDWEVIRADVGATATLLVEMLRERDMALKTIQATLLLLGIYEDTGSLTYTRTTSRDLQAASYLLDQGADLRVATNFLNHPLSQAQQELYDRLRQVAKHHHIHGFTVIIACGEAGEMEEELSSIAHKLRDLLDPDALFLLIKTRGGVQMIARSTSDNIDVAAILGHYGGGGHERAAAGLVRDKSVDELCEQLLDILPEYIEPSITVVEIMSQRPQVLTPSTPVEEAFLRMQRFGYEGYPVVEQGKIVGLLNRRSVDRAMAHNLNLNVGSLMEVGDISVYPDDSIEKLKRIVTESGWGQIPVIDRHSKEIIGIVTRTDLLKTLPPQPKLPRKHNLGPRLEAALPPDRLKLLNRLAEEAHQQHVAVYIVGGFVRDLLLDRPSLDFDLVVEGDAIELAKSISAKYGGRVTSHSRFGTAKWHLPEAFPNGESLNLPDLKFIDLVSARTEFYQHPTALPTVERGSIKLDLHRRDFTINTLALRLDGHHYGELHDYWGGLDDLKTGIVRVLHSLSFVDDPTRMLRAVRFEQRFSFVIEDRTLELLVEARGLLDRVSGDRIRHELNNILQEDQVANILARLEELKLLSRIHPELTWDEWLDRRISALPNSLPESDWELTYYESETDLRKDLCYVIWLIRLTPGQAQEVIERIKLPIQIAKTIIASCELWRKLPLLVEASPSDIVDQLEGLPTLARYAVFLATSDGHLKNILTKYATKWRNIDTNISGDELKARGLPPSPTYRYILKALRDAWLDERISTKKQEQALLDKLIETQEFDVNF